MHKCAHTVDIYTTRVWFAREDLWGGVARGADHESSHIFRLRKFLSAAEVGDFYLRLACEVGHQNVFNLDILMDDVSPVHGLDTSCHLADDALGKILVQGLAGLCADVVEQVAGLHVVRDDHVVLLSGEALDQLHHVGAVRCREFLHDLHLCKLCFVFAEGLRDFFLANDFDGDLDAGKFMLGEDDFAEGALVELLDRLVRVHAIVKVALRGKDLLVLERAGRLTIEVNRALLVCGEHEQEAEESCRGGLESSVNLLRRVRPCALERVERVPQNLVLRARWPREHDVALADAHSVALEVSGVRLEEALILGNGRYDVLQSVSVTWIATSFFLVHI